MSDTLTPFYALTQPEVGGSANTWGTKLNADLALIDQLLAAPAPKSGTVDPTTGVLNLSQSTVFVLVPTQAVQVTFLNAPVDGASIVWLIVQNGGSQTITYQSDVFFLDGLTPTLSNTGGTDVLVFLRATANGTGWLGLHAGDLDTGQVSTDALADAAVTAVKIANAAVTEAKLAAGLSGRAKIHPSGDGSIAENTDTQVTWTGPTSDYNVGSFTVSTSGIAAPSGAAFMVLTAQVSFATLGDPSADAAAKIKLWIEGPGSVVVGQQFFQLDSQNSSTQGMAMQVTAFVNTPSASDTYVVKVRTPVGVGTATLQAANSWFAAHLVP